ncbi:hypothetical protein [Pediococcus acidilactici]|uniref:hypothetical protein n=1 Tax=Pediococcus acidilactici TaxID=1254 RepID=UPI001C70AAF7|nr:hypothetical protein [Pediococcus acidilactici]MBW9300546.1 hypothetical protein [Pediococcus acidilactici]
MNSNEVKELICNRLWYFQFVAKKYPYAKHPGPLSLSIDPDDQYSYLTIKFNENGKITFPTRLGFIPIDYCEWDFDVAHQEIVIIGKDGQIKKRAQLPQKDFFYNTDTIVFKQEDPNAQNTDFLLNFPHYDAFEIRQQDINERAIVFIPQAFFNVGITQYCTRRGYTIYSVDHQNKFTNFLQEILEYLMDHPHLNNVIISRNPSSEMELNFPRGLDHVLLSCPEGTSSFNYCAGERSVILELLIMLVTENNKLQLNPEDNRSVDELFVQLLETKFASRIEYAQ